MPLRTQGYCGVGRGLSGLHWLWCNGRGLHLEWTQEPQASSPFLTRIPWSLQSRDKRVTPSLLLRNGPSFAFRVVYRVTGHLSKCLWDLRVFLDDARAFIIFNVSSETVTSELNSVVTPNNSFV